MPNFFKTEHKPLSKYSNNDLYDYLKRNEALTALQLGVICSEILKRQIEGRFKLDSLEACQDS